MESPTLRPVWVMPSPMPWMAPPTVAPAPAMVVSTAFQKGSRMPMLVGGSGGLGGLVFGWNWFWIWMFVVVVEMMGIAGVGVM